MKLCAGRRLADIARELSHLPGIGRGGLLDLSDFKRLSDQAAANDAAYAQRVHDGQHPLAAFIDDVANYDIRNAPADLARRGRMSALRLPTDADGRAALAAQLRDAGKAEGPRDRSIVDLSRFNERKTKSAPQDETASFDSQAQEAAFQAAADLTSAQKELTKDIQARSDLEKQAVDATTDKRLAALAAQEAKIRASKVDTHKAQQLALLDVTRSDVQAAAVAKKTLIDRQAADAQIAADRTQRDIEAGLRDRHASAAETLLTSAQASADVELQAFRDRLNDALVDFKTQQDQAVSDHEISPEQRDANVAGYRRQNQEDLVAERTRQQRAINPLYERAHPTTTVAEDLQGLEARELDGVTDGLTRLVTGATDAKTAFHDMVTSILADVVRLAVQRSIEAPLANFLFGASPTKNLGALGAGGGSVSIAGSAFNALFGGGFLGLPGHASGANSFGGLTRLNEQRPEGVAFLPSNTQIIPNDTLRGLANLKPESLARPAGGVTLNVSVDAGGAFSFDHVAAAVEGGVHRAVAASGLQLAATTRRQQDAARNSLRSF